jgi:hypothetical protein
MTKKAFIKIAREKGLKVKINHVKRDTPLRDLCSRIRMKKDIPLDQLLPCR